MKFPLSFHLEPVGTCSNKARPSEDVFIFSITLVHVPTKDHKPALVQPMRAKPLPEIAKRYLTVAHHGRVPRPSAVDTHDALFEPDSFRAALPVLRQEWRGVLRDPCSRTNS